jgi:adenylate cyclase
MMGFGAHRGESEAQAGKRRIVIGYLVFGSVIRVVIAALEFSEGLYGVAWIDLAAAGTSVMALIVLKAKPLWFYGIATALLGLIMVEVSAGTVVLGGMVPSAMVVLFGLLSVVGALILFPVRNAWLWFGGFLVTLMLAVVLPEWIQPIHDVESSPGEIAFTITGVTAFVFAGMAYFVRQRDRFQQESDDLLHNILPDEIAARLKADRSMIADDYDSASVLFADVVDFTPMSAGMSPPHLVGLLNAVFTVFDEFVQELGLEKIKTVGDEYMAAAGVPRQRPDHAQAISELALRIREHCENHEFDGHQISLRIGINSGPVVAGIVGTHKFAYDLWGDVVNTASRMESEGVPGAIQISANTYQLIKDDFVCEPRGLISVKGKGELETYFLVSRRAATPPMSPLDVGGVLTRSPPEGTAPLLFDG